MIPAEHYLKMRYRGVVTLESVEEESNEKSRLIRETVACSDEAGDHWLLNMTWIVAKNHIRIFDRGTKNFLEEEAYADLLKTHQVGDTPEYVEELERRRAAAQDELDSLAPLCPHCNTRTIFLSKRQMAKHGGSVPPSLNRRYWGCPNDDCGYRAEVNPDALERFFELSAKTRLV